MVHPLVFIFKQDNHQNASFKERKSGLLCIKEAFRLDFLCSYHITECIVIRSMQKMLKLNKKNLTSSLSSIILLTLLTLLSSQTMSYFVSTVKYYPLYSVLACGRCDHGRQYQHLSEKEGDRL